VSILIIQILNSLFYASVLFLIAAGLSLIFGVMRIVNMAHGTLYGIGAFVTAWLVGRAVAAGMPVWLAFLCILWGGLPLTADAVMDVVPSMHIGGFIYPGYYLIVIGIGIVAALGLWLVIYRTRFGVLLRATSQDRRMASALGLNVGLVYVSAFAIGCFMAGLGGAVIVPSQAAVLGMGIDALILAFVVVVIGGLGSLQGALVGALIVSFVRTLMIQFAPEIELAVLYLIAAGVLLVRPTGLFGSA